MKFSTLPAISLTLAGAVSAAPACKVRDDTGSGSSCGLSVTAAQISVIAPQTASCTTTGGECSTAETAAKWISKAACDYGVTKNEMMGVIALIAFESGGFAYKVNTQAKINLQKHAGQGTANMQNYRYNFLYAQSLPAVKEKVSQFATADDMSLNERNDILLPAVIPDEYNFGSGFWYLTAAQTSKCDPVRKALSSDLESAFSSYMTDCVETTMTKERDDVLQRVIKAFASY